MHDPSAHDQLAPSDLVNHLPDHHDRFPAEILDFVVHPTQVSDALEARGIPATTPADAYADLDPWQCDALLVWHETAHEVGDEGMQR